MPFRDFFGGIFFFSFGLTVDLFSLGGAVWLAIGAALLSVVGVVIAGQLAGRAAGHSEATSFNVGLTLLGRRGVFDHRSETRAIRRPAAVNSTLRSALRINPRVSRTVIGEGIGTHLFLTSKLLSKIRKKKAQEEIEVDDPDRNSFE